jgi:hypothetical protein
MSLDPLGLPPSRQTRVLLPDDPETVEQLREQRDDARDMVAQLTSEHALVLALHHPHGDYCKVCGTRFPCRTRVVLTHDEDGAE